MTDDPSESTDARGLIRALLVPLRAPQRVVENLETIASVLLSLESNAHERAWYRSTSVLARYSRRSTGLTARSPQSNSWSRR